MADLTADTVHKTYPRAGRVSFTVANGVTLYAGALVGINAGGYLAKWADTAGHKFAGVLLAGAVGNTSATPPVEGRVDTSGLTIKGALVASLAVTDVNALVYCTTDNPADFSLSAGSNTKAVGWVSRYISSGVGDVTLFTPEEHWGLN